MLSYTGGSSPVYPPQRHRAWPAQSQPKAPDPESWLRARIAPAQLWEWRMLPHPGIIRQEAAPELCLLGAQQGVREAVAVQRKRPPTLRGLSSSSTEVRAASPERISGAAAPRSHPRQLPPLSALTAEIPQAPWITTGSLILHCKSCWLLCLSQTQLPKLRIYCICQWAGKPCAQAKVVSTPE